MFIDSESFSYLLKEDDIVAKRILNWADPVYKSAEYLEFSRSNFDTDYDELNKINSFEFRLDDEFDRDEFNLRYGPGTWTFTHEMTELKCQKIFNTLEFNQKQQRITSLLINFCEFILRDDEDKKYSNYPIIYAGYTSDNTNLLITSNKLLLNKRRYFEKSLNGYLKNSEVYPINIVTLDEANEIIDLFCKSRDGHYFGNTRTDEWLWYWYSFRTKIPYYNVKDSFYESLANRFVFVLKCIDEMGKLYYHGVTNSTQKNLLYHFNYYISLLTGIFDNLALITNEKYNIHDYQQKELISLNPNNNVFIKKIKSEDETIHNHIKEYINFLKVIHNMRNPIIHREMFKMIFLTYDEIDLNTLIINDKILQYIKGYPKEINKFKRLEWWGVHNFAFSDSENKYYLEPYQFSKSATKILIEFTNDYLKLLGENHFLDQLEEKNKEIPVKKDEKKNKEGNDLFLIMIKQFKETHLGF